jgi:predicted 3-demethylubiquinone-9 3-methyltransferase (glyoxalase superfamily)
MQKISPFLWFDTQAEEAANFYVSVFKDGKLGKAMRYGEGGPGPAGSVLTISFQLHGQDFTALNGGPMYAFSPAISFVVDCETQEETDELWAKLSADPASEQCGWLKDKFGVSWQIIPREMHTLLGDKDPQRAGKAMQAMMKMKKLDMPAMRKAMDA